MNKIDPDAIIAYLMPPSVRKIPFREYSSKRKALVGAAREAFEKGEGRLEELLGVGRLNEEKKQVFAIMEEHISRLLLFDLRHDAYVFVMRYAAIQQKYVIH